MMAERRQRLSPSPASCGRAGMSKSECIADRRGRKLPIGGSKLPWMKFFPADWRADLGLRTTSLAARGLWIEMLTIMHEAAPRGSLSLNGRQLTVRDLALLTAAAQTDVA